MTAFFWQLDSPIDAVVFDCDGTLSTIEGIDELARENGVGKEVTKLTAEAMGTLGMNPELYQKRLALVQPRLEQVHALGKEYFSHQVPDVHAVIQLFKRFNKSIYLVSAGLHPALKIFGRMLTIPQKNIFSVDIQFDEQGNYLDYEHTSPMVYSDGKRTIVNELKTRHARIAYIGDGLNDLPVYDLVTRFVGFGGAYFRQNIADVCKYYILALTMSPLAPLLLTANECEKLTANEQPLYAKGLSMIDEKKVLIK